MMRSPRTTTTHPACDASPSNTRSGWRTKAGGTICADRVAAAPAKTTAMNSARMLALALVRRRRNGSGLSRPGFLPRVVALAQRLHRVAALALDGVVVRDA